METIIIITLYLLVGAVLSRLYFRNKFGKQGVTSTLIVCSFWPFFMLFEIVSGSKKPYTPGGKR